MQKVFAIVVFEEGNGGDGDPAACVGGGGRLAIPRLCLWNDEGGIRERSVIEIESREIVLLSERGHGGESFIPGDVGIVE